MNKASSQPLEYLQGQIERVTYANEENSYTVAKFKVRGRRDLLTGYSTESGHPDHAMMAGQST